MPGIDDAFQKIRIDDYLNKNIERILPVLIIALGCGGFSELQHYNELIKHLKKARVPAVIVFTKFENLLNDIKARMKEQEDPDAKPTI